MLPGPRCSELTNAVATVEADDIGFTLSIADSTIINGGRGLYAGLQQGVDEVILPSGTKICGYCTGRFVESTSGDKAVPFAFSDAQMLVMWKGELRPLQAAVTESGATKVFGHKVQRYGPGGVAVMVTLDETVTQRILVPNEEDARDTTALELATIGQFCNDLAFDGAEGLEKEDAFWEYEKRSQTANVLTLAWRLDLDDDGETLVPRELQLITSRDVRLSEPEMAVEIGLHYGVNYWRELVSRGFATS